MQQRWQTGIHIVALLLAAIWGMNLCPAFTSAASLPIPATPAKATDTLAAHEAKCHCRQCPLRTKGKTCCCDTAATVSEQLCFRAVCDQETPAEISRTLPPIIVSTSTLCPLPVLTGIPQPMALPSLLPTGRTTVPTAPPPRTLS